MFYSIRVMKKVLFIITHLGSGSFELFNSLIKVPSIDGFKMDISYRHPDDLKLLTKNIHKKNDASAIYMDELLYNHSLLSKKLAKFCNLIYLVREPKSTLNKIIADNPSYSLESAARYYCYRLRGILEYYRKVSVKCPFLKWENISEDKKSIESYLGLETSLEISSDEYVDHNLDYKILLNCQERYDHYLFQMRRIRNFLIETS